jgi:predicted DNA-binding transcriptional regulator AlpA
MAAVQSVTEFCNDNGICRATLYALWERGEGPRKMRVGRKVLIRAEDAEAWRLARMEPDDAKAA